MAKLNPRTGFVIKLSEETVQKLAEEEKETKEKSTDNQIEDTTSVEDINNDKIQNVQDVKTTSQTLDVPTSHSIENSTVESTLQKENSSQTEKIVLNITDDKDENDKDNTLEDNEKTKKSSKSITDSSTWGEYASYITYKDNEAIYTDPSSGQAYTWNKTSNAWDAKGDEAPGRVYSYEDDTHIYTEADGSKYFWDETKKAWIPKVDDDFLAYYQMSYGFIENKKDDDEKEKGSDKKKELQKEAMAVKRKSEPQWFEPTDDKNTKVYVSNLPLDMTEQEFVDLMQKCGLVERDPSNQKMKVKLYMDKEQNCFKGDALCTYIKIESVDLALKLLDGSDCKGNTIKVERAHFQLKGKYNPALKPKKRRKKELEKIKKMKEKLFDWRPEKFIGERSKHERVVIVKNLFHSSDFDKEVQLILDYQQDLREECGKCGDVRKVVLYDRHPEGVAQITMKEPEQADAVVQLINGRWFGKRQITAEIWDGKTKYKIAETDADINQRLDKWGKFLEEKEDDNKVIKLPVEEKDTDELKVEEVSIEKENTQDLSEKSDINNVKLEINQ
ncbi:HIV Tat-specific factor 1 homolog [Bombyx mandarina]|uniref:17S U2 SnRNP complex component HTATSF1 n=1 Tax=Bombyx mandarina TaxID=7092 RepID=A0A6J2JQL0_BOMMA|nr:HIV Tat-specific factor 1 homolog [Bombyx mandarina]